jgi:sterol desaturase/sphingolipid hydroxylase (fatty acid hydroxylase superfamily)
MQKTVLEIGQYILTINLLRYFFVATPLFLIFYVFFKRKWQFKKIQDKFPKNKDYQREIGYSLISIVIFAAVGLSIFGTNLKNYTLKYANIADMGWAYWVLSILLMILLHDTYFYWTHRAMHHPKLFKYLHLTHHKSTNPSPWAAYSFHPLEGVVEAAVIYPIVFLIPYHGTAILVFLMFMMIYNVYGHLGFELYPKGFNKHPIGKWLNTSVNHNQHHKQFNGNYGLYFLFWDRISGTIREDYDAEFLEIDKKRK